MSLSEIPKTFPTFTYTYIYIYIERERDLEEMLRIGGVSKCVSERLPVLRQHATARVGNFDSIVRDFVVRSGYHQSDNRFGLMRPKCGQNPNPKHRGMEQRRVGSEAGCAVRQPHSFRLKLHNQNQYNWLGDCEEERSGSRSRVEEKANLEAERNETRIQGGELAVSRSSSSSGRSTGLQHALLADFTHFCLSFVALTLFFWKKKKIHILLL